VPNRLAQADKAIPLHLSARPIELAQAARRFDRALVLAETFLKSLPEPAPRY
jgi:hypothetical protein